MSTQWWYKSLGQEFGPLSFDDLIEAARLGTFVSHDSVRDSNSPWRRADSVAGLFPDAHGDKWLVEVIGQTLGPLSLAEVTTMIRQRKLLPGDRIRHVDAANWQALSAILNRADGELAVIECSGTSSGEVPNDLESLILSVLGAPSDCYEKPSLAELGLAALPAVEGDGISTPVAKAAPADLPGTRPPLVGAGSFAVKMIGRAWRASQLNQDSLDPRQQQLEDASDQTTAPSRQRAIKRSFDAPASDNAHLLASASRGIPWRALVLAGGSILLVLQLYPALAIRTIAAIDVRNWAWNNWLAAEVTIVCVLIGLAVWRRR